MKNFTVVIRQQSDDKFRKTSSGDIIGNLMWPVGVPLPRSGERLYLKLTHHQCSVWRLVHSVGYVYSGIGNASVELWIDD